MYVKLKKINWRMLGIVVAILTLVISSWMLILTINKNNKDQQSEIYKATIENLKIQISHYEKKLSESNPDKVNSVIEYYDNLLKIENTKHSLTAQKMQDSILKVSHIDKALIFVDSSYIKVHRDSLFEALVNLSEKKMEQDFLKKMNRNLELINSLKDSMIHNQNIVINNQDEIINFKNNNKSKSIPIYIIFLINLILLFGLIFNVNLKNKIKYQN